MSIRYYTISDLKEKSKSDQVVLNLILGPVAQEEICAKRRHPSHPPNKVGLTEHQNQEALQIFEYQDKVTLLETCLVNLCFKAVIKKIH